jgi:hypothetical protein
VAIAWSPRTRSWAGIAGREQLTVKSDADIDRDLVGQLRIETYTGKRWLSCLAWLW